ncbi:NADH:flavin oxidoreductase/NADH oxidase family protein [Pseudophaeobacter sp. EL27]|uniref:NADH:flavin oxidoreductase/NADH oxidase family protein n=1 Tax=Pseudophaeobacter sp. EL27 TaxID=2107580 RepID=UPI000EFCCF67|nr:NADH:flavin oxidoreductase/NADH oxidase family protein [Pseudophaeobacter sp. EL27]
MQTDTDCPLFSPLTLPNGQVLKNRIIKSAMSDSLADGQGNPTAAQIRLYERWAKGGLAASIIGEVQGDPDYPEKPGNLVLDAGADLPRFRELARRGSGDGAQLWLQLGHAGALSHLPISRPKGPSAITFPDFTSEAMSLAEIKAVPKNFAATARRAAELGFGGVQIHAAHGFLLSQFLSPLFNQRTDAYGGTVQARMRLLIETVEAIRAAVPADFVVAVKLNATDQLDGGLSEAEALQVVAALDGTGVDLLDISGGTYFPGAPSSSERATRGPYFLDFARAARKVTSIPLMATGGFKQYQEAEAAILAGDVDVVGIARGFVLDPALPATWQAGKGGPVFPRFTSLPAGGMTAWFTMRMADLGEDRDGQPERDITDALDEYDIRDAQRIPLWRERFSLS